jgi:flavodoxin/ferredoxin
MSKCLLVYYSQGGTTGRIAGSIAKGLRAADHVVDLHNLKDGPAPDPGMYDVLGLGTPTYYFRPPFIVTDHLKSLPDLPGKPFFVYVVYGTDCGDAGNIVRRALERKGGKEIGYSRYFGADYFLGFLKRGYLFSPGHPKPDEIARAEVYGREIAACLGGKEYRKAEFDGPTNAMYRLERFFVNRLFARQMYSRLFGVDRAKCNACGLCMKLCPTGNISKDKNGHPSWERNCILCLSCEMKCPKDAISSPVTWSLFQPFMIYNIRRASRDPRLEMVRVEHARGRTRIVGQ